ncbi:MAG: PQQ-binding-like beta-propeller repeat protein [Candidatus Bathyarchaeales archaeon]
MENVRESQQRAEIFDALGHPTRILILKALNEEPLGFADLKKKLGIDSSGHLQHHLNKLDGLIQTDEYGKYRLSEQGREALLIVQTVEKAAGSASEPGKSRRGLRSVQILKVISILLAVALVATSIVAAFEYVQLQSQLGDRSKMGVVWKRELYVNIAYLAVADGKVFTVTFDGDLYCFDQQNGQTLWSQSLGGYTMSNQIIVENGSVFVGSRGSILNCISENDGKTLWRFAPNLSSSIASKSAPVFSLFTGRVFTTGDGFYVLKASDGKLLWKYPYGSIPNYVGIGGWAVADNHVFAGGWDNGDKLFCFSIDDGSVLWQYDMRVNNPPIISNGRVFVWNYDNGTSIACFDESKGQLLWQLDANATIFRPTLYDKVLLFGDANGNFYALSEEGSLIWTFMSRHETSNYPSSAAPLIFNKTVIVGYEAGYVTCLRLSDGKLVWRTPVGGNVKSLTLANNKLCHFKPFGNKLVYYRPIFWQHSREANL